tara:strand:+ start:1280 stop:1741 length:462 start_codon:yes stop_codon:yes gene_type:complete
MESFAKYVESRTAHLQNSLEDYAVGGKVSLYHYASKLGGKNPETIQLTPERFGENPYSRNELKAGTPRIFFYLDIQDKEPYFFNSPLYKAEVPVSKIYNIIEDPLEIIRGESGGALDMDMLLREVSSLPGIEGMYYKPQMQIVIWFHPIQVSL